MIITTTLLIHPINTSCPIELPVVYGISAGFPSPANDYMEDVIDLNKTLIRNPGATFYGRVKGVSMKDAGIDDGDILIVDKSIAPSDGRIAVCCIDGEFTLKQISIGARNSLMLLPANKQFKPILVSDDTDFLIWGIVTYVIKKMP